MYQVEIQLKTGACNNTLLEKMLKKGDVAFIKLEEMINCKINVLGIMRYTAIVIEDDGTISSTNNYLLVAVKEGYIRTSSNVFEETLMDYIDDVREFYIRKIKCKSGVTYKPEPILNHTNTKEDVVNE